MASAGTSFLARAKQALAKYVRPPWRYTGPLASPEFRPSLVQAGEYRPIAPTNIPGKASVPSSDLDRVFNIKYHDRERRRVEFEVKKEAKTVGELVDEIRAGGGSGGSTEGTAAVGEYLPPRPGSFYVYGQDRHLNDCPGEGYQK